MKLRNRVAVISGANRGLGEAVARAFAKEGASLLLIARDAALLRRVADSLPQEAHQNIAWTSADVSNLTDVETVRDQVVSGLSRVDILVNNAGIYGPIGRFEEVDWQEWCDAININLLGTVAMTRALVPMMKQQGYGKIINLSGGGATAPLPRFSAYAASKTGETFPVIASVFKKAMYLRFGISCPRTGDGSPRVVRRTSWMRPGRKQASARPWVKPPAGSSGRQRSYAGREPRFTALRL